MKNLKFILVAGLMAVSAPAFAQFANTGNAGNNRSASSTSIENGYSRLELSYNPVKVSPDYDNADDLDLTGISLGYVKGFSISKTVPLYVETGLRLTYAWWSEDDSDSGTSSMYVDDYGYVDYNYYTERKDKLTYLGLTIPVNLAYRFAVPNSDVTVTPFVGVTLRGNIIGKNKVEASATVTAPDYGVSETKSDEEEYNMFDKEEAGGKDYQWKRFQFGWNIGANVAFNKFSVGLSYGSDFSELYKKTKTSNWAVSVGYNF